MRPRRPPTTTRACEPRLSCWRSAAGRPWPAAAPQRPSNRQPAAHRPASSPLRLSRELFERAALDPEVARVLEGTSGDPELITRNMERVMSDTYDRIISPDPTGEDRPMQVR